MYYLFELFLLIRAMINLLTNRGNKNVRIRTKYFLTYTARFEINNKPRNNNSTNKYKSYNKPMCVILHNLKLNRNYQTKYVIMTLITDNTFYLFYKNKKSLMKFCYLHSSYDNNTRRQIEDRQMTRKSHNQRLSKLL